MQDIEFTVQQDKLFMLQTRNGKRTAKAALRIAVEMANEGLIDQAGSGDARRPGARSTSCCTRPSIPAAERTCIANGLPASPGRRLRARSCSPPTRPKLLEAQGEAVILVRIETSPEDIHGMHAAAASSPRAAA